MLEDLANRHVKRVLAAAEAGGGPSEIDIVRSWLRCLESYGIDPAQAHQTPVLEKPHLAERRDRLDPILETAHAEMSNLYRHIAGSGFAIILTDSEGVIIDWIGDPNRADRFTGAGLWPGAIWNEENEGTNGIGTCLVEKRPLTVHCDEHFRARHIGLTCSAAPIFDPYGNLLAVLDNSAVSSEDTRQSQFHTLALATLSARLIENSCFLQQFRKSWVLHFHKRPEFVGLISEGMAAFDGEGKVLGVNQGALVQLDCPDRRQLLGRRMEELFDLNLMVLLERASRNPGTVWPMRDRRGRHCFAMLRGPEIRLSQTQPHTAPTSAGLHRTVDNERSTGNHPPSGLIEPLRTPPPMTLDGLQGDDPLMAYNVRCARRVMNKKIHILLTGETGTGKEAIARAIHNASDRACSPFVAVNCASIPENLIESELFGYKHGAFTGARREGMRGKILQASGGTLFLDEIGDMPCPLQTRLLRVLEDEEVLPLGSETPIPAELHVITATHRNLRERVATGAFREDLYYRLNGLTLHLPALRERVDRTLLIRSVLAMESEGAMIWIDEATFMALNTYPWPGNIRELRNVLRTAVALCENSVIRLADLPFEVTRVSSGNLARRVHPPTPAGSPLAGAEREALLKELDKHHWNITSTSHDLGISRNTLYRKMRKHGIAALR
jgi:transcriptional regulator of acetoin/glycerol metabolism